MSAGNRVAASSPAGSIYDLGYRHYEGKRHGRGFAVWSLYVDSLRGIWGFGRPMSAKAAPFILAGLYALPAIIQLAFSSVIVKSIQQSGTAGDLFTFGNYFGGMGTLIVLFLVAQAPEVVCRDQRYQVLPLYFTRAMGRFDYAMARLLSLATALLVVLMVPVIALFIGDILMSADAFKAIGNEWPKALPTIPSSLLIAAGMASIALALSSYSPRRAYAAVGVLAYFLLVELVPLVIYGIGHEAGAKWVDYLPLITPISGLSGANCWFFGTPIPSGFPSSIGAEAYVLAALAGMLLFTGILVWRYRRMAV